MYLGVQDRQDEDTRKDLEANGVALPRVQLSEFAGRDLWLRTSRQGRKQMHYKKKHGFLKQR